MHAFARLEQLIQFGVSQDLVAVAAKCAHEITCCLRASAAAAEAAQRFSRLWMHEVARFSSYEKVSYPWVLSQVPVLGNVITETKTLKASVNSILTSFVLFEAVLRRFPSFGFNS